MTVYVDDMEAPFGRGDYKMKLCHMIADTEAEMHEMADKIGVARKWYQGDHYDIAKGKKALALKYGAIAITWRQAGCMHAFFKRGLPMPDPKFAPERLKELFGADRADCIAAALQGAHGAAAK